MPSAASRRHSDSTHHGRALSHKATGPRLLRGPAVEAPGIETRPQSWRLPRGPTHGVPVFQHAAREVTHDAVQPNAGHQPALAVQAGASVTWHRVVSRARDTVSEEHPTKRRAAFCPLFRCSVKTPDPNPPPRPICRETRERTWSRDPAAFPFTRGSRRPDHGAGIPDSVERRAYHPAMTPDELGQSVHALPLPTIRTLCEITSQNPTSDEKRTRRHARWKLARDLMPLPP